MFKIHTKILSAAISTALMLITHGCGTTLLNSKKSAQTIGATLPFPQPVS